MKITNKTVGWGIAVLFVSTCTVFPFIHYIYEPVNESIFGSSFYSFWRGFIVFGILVAIVGGVFNAVCLMITGGWEFEYEIKIPKSKRKVVDELYKELGKASIAGNEYEANKIMDKIDRLTE